jgi:hypothetical protein
MLGLKNIKQNIILGGVLVMALPILAHATSTVPGVVDPFGSNANMKSPVTNIETDLINGKLITAIKWTYTIFFIVAVFFFLLAAYNFLLGGSNEERVKTAKNQLTYGVIAIVVALIASGISLIIFTFLSTGA